MAIIENKPSLLELIDTAGQDEYSAALDKYIQAGEGFLLVYSLTSRSSFNTAKWLYVKILRQKVDEALPIVLMGNKSDLENDRIVSRKEAEEFSKKNSLSYFETSAKSGKNIQESIQEVVIKLREYKNTSKRKEEKRKKKENEKKGAIDSKSGCCTFL
ncbi:ras-like protein [Anaeramoeba flamelloides]|uniref:Ras-like protein n=1 Tax=Anaeramoeba flamelloides TaxID=1746091 RepID=A0ABQ8Z6G9_9EUKA|nr:ras-like protein [Anaeramoeba flamelloides]